MAPHASCHSLVVVCRWSRPRRPRFSHLSPLAFHVATCRFDTTLLPYSDSVGEGKWLSMGVALSITPASPCGVDTTRGATVTGYKPSHDWHKPRRQGLLPTVGGILGSHWTAIARLKLGSPHTEEEEETLFDPKSANVQCITLQ